MIPPPIAIPLTYSPPPLPGWGLSSFPPVSPDAQIRPYKARPALPLCDTLVSGRRAYKRPTRQRKRGQWFQSLQTTAQCAPATGPPSLATATGPPSLATGPPCAPNKRFTWCARRCTGPPCARILLRHRENPPRTYTGENRRWNIAGIFEKSDVPRPGVALDLVETSYTETRPEIRPKFAARFRLRETTRAST